MIDIGRALQHPFQDPNWLSKLGIGALVNIVPILNFAGTGYIVEQEANVKRGTDVPMPTWDKLGDLFMQGLKLVVVFFIYSLPIIALSCVLAFAGAGIATIASASENADQAAGAGISILSLALSCVAIIYAVFLVYLYPAIIIQFARSRDIAACLRISEIFAIARKNSGDYIMIFLVLIGVSLVFSIIGSILAITVVGLCLLIPLSLLATPYINVVIAHLCGQYDRNVDPVTTPRPDFVPPA